jgi:hypothetical protein
MELKCYPSSHVSVSILILGFEMPIAVFSILVCEKKKETTQAVKATPHIN